jgi:hypothetical protein
MPDPANVRHNTIFLPSTSLNVGHSNIPSIIPRGYADEREPNDAPIGREKCFPRAGCMGDVIVIPEG